MIKKIIVLGLIIFAAIIFYKKFMADTLETFFRGHKENTDFLQQKVRDYKVK